MELEEMIEHIYDLSRDEMRRLALELLLASDGPDRVKEST